MAKKLSDCMPMKQQPKPEPKRGEKQAGNESHAYNWRSRENLKRGK